MASWAAARSITCDSASSEATVPSVESRIQSYIQPDFEQRYDKTSPRLPHSRENERGSLPPFARLSPHTLRVEKFRRRPSAHRGSRSVRLSPPVFPLAPPHRRGHFGTRQSHTPKSWPRHSSSTRHPPRIVAPVTPAAAASSRRTSSVSSVSNRRDRRESTAAATPAG